VSSWGEFDSPTALLLSRVIAAAPLASGQTTGMDDVRHDERSVTRPSADDSSCSIGESAVAAIVPFRKRRDEASACRDSIAPLTTRNR
jgi:hypothetical protein